MTSELNGSKWHVESVLRCLPFREEFHSVSLEGSTVKCTLFVKFSVLLLLQGWPQTCTLFCLMKMRPECHKNEHLTPTQIQNCFIGVGCY
jgi:hypothetical protein